MSQLELFRSKEQEERLVSKLERHKKQQLQNEKNFNTIQKEFDRVGMIENLHYKIEGKPIWSSKSKEFEISSWKEPNVIENVDVEFFGATIKIKYDRYYSHNNELNHVKDTVSHEKKSKWKNGSYTDTVLFGNYTLVGSYRNVKAETLKQKIEDSVKIAKRQKENDSAQMKAINKKMKELQTKYPDADLSYDTWRGTRITVQFKSGSYIDLEQYYNGNWNERKSYDANFRKLSVKEKMDMFNKQEAKKSK
tara:strand:- start:4739 stop:5488 length:750 start_codon:yes stop_codon:yes gene_type:complete